MRSKSLGSGANEPPSEEELCEGGGIGRGGGERMRHAARTPGMGFLRWAPRMSEGERRAFSRAPSPGRTARRRRRRPRRPSSRRCACPPRGTACARGRRGRGVWVRGWIGPGEGRRGGGAWLSFFSLRAKRHAQDRFPSPRLARRRARRRRGRQREALGVSGARSSAGVSRIPRGHPRLTATSTRPSLRRWEGVGGRWRSTRALRRSTADRPSPARGARGVIGSIASPGLEAPRSKTERPIDPIGEPIPVRPFSAVSTSPIRITKIGEISRSRDLFAEAATLSTRRPRPRARAHCLARRRHLSPAHERC